MNKKNNIIKKIIICFLIGIGALTMLHFVNTPKVEAATVSGTLRCSATSQNSITLTYTTKNGTNASLFRGNSMIVGLGSGNKSGSYKNTGLTAGKSYTFYLRNGTSSGSTELARVTCSTTAAPKPAPAPTPASGTLRCSATSQNSITLTYTTKNGTNASLFRGSTRIVGLGSGNKSGSYKNTGLTAGKSYTFYLRNGTSSGSTELARVTCSTAAAPKPAPAPTPASGTLRCSATSQNSITLTYTTKNGTNASLFRGSTRIVGLGSGNKSGSYKNTGLTAGKSYTFYLRNGTSSGSTELARVTCSTTAAPKPAPAPTPASGTLRCSATSQNSITLTYTTKNGTNASLFRGSTRIVGLGSGNKSGSYKNTGLTAGKSYTFYLRNGTSSGSTELARVTCSTAAAPKPAPAPAPTPTPTPKPTPINGVCGTAAKNYSADQTKWLSGVSFCSTGTASPTNPIFPSTGQIISWICKGKDGGSSATCYASREKKSESEKPVGSLTCYSSSQNSITLKYNYFNGNNISLFKESSKEYTFGSGNNSGTRKISGLKPGKSYTFFLKNGTSYSSQTLSTATCQTDNEDRPETSGYLICGTSGSDYISLNYKFNEGDDVSLFRDGKRIYTWGEDSKQGTYTDWNIISDRSYVYRLVNGKTLSYTEIDWDECRALSKDTSFYISKQVRSITQNTAWTNKITVKPGENISFSIKIIAGSENDTDVVVRDILPTNITYAGNLRLDGSSISGDIDSGIDIFVPKGQSKTLTFDTQIAGESNFGVGSTNLKNTATASNKEKTSNSTAEIYVQKGIVAGVATGISTGITNNKIIDFVLLPLAISLILFFLFKKYFVILSDWLERKKIAISDFRAKRILGKELARIRAKEEK